MTCPHCGQVYALPVEQAPQYAGQTLTCTRCRQPFTVSPAIATPAAAAAAAAATTFPPADPRDTAFGNQYAYVAPRANGLAITALVLGALGLAFPPIGVVGIILAVIALVQIARHPEQTGKGLALGAIGAAVLGFAVWGCLASVALPSLSKARQNAQQVACASNLRAIGQGLMIYASQNNNRYPDRLDQIVSVFGGAGQMFVCPASGDTPAVGTPQQVAAQLAVGQHLSYVFVAPGWTPGGSGASKKVVAYEAAQHRHGDGMNVLWGDGHVSFEGPASAAQIVQKSSAATQPTTHPEE